MLNKFSTRLSDKIGSPLKSTIEEKEIYAYSIEVLLSLFINLIILSITAYITNKVSELIIFIIFFSGLRTFAGGYHAKTHIECITLSFLLFIISAMSNTFFIHFGEIVMITGIIASNILVFKYAPTESKNKPLNGIEAKKYKSISRGTVILLSIAIITLYFNKIQTDYIYLTAIVAMFLESISLINLFNM